MLIKVNPDTTYGLGVVAIRFTVEAGTPVSMIPVLAYPTLKKAIEQFERLGDGKGHHYRFRDDIAIRFEYSRLQADPYTMHINDYINGADRHDIDGMIDCVAYVTFEQPLIIPQEQPLIDEKDGVVPYEKLPDFLKDEDTASTEEEQGVVN